MICDVCDENADQTFNLGCGHKLCAGCFSEAIAKKCCSPHIECGSCNQYSRRWTVEIRGDNACLESSYKSNWYEIEQPTLHKDPKQFHKILPREDSEKQCILSLTVNTKDGNIATLASALDMEKKPEEWDSHTVANLVNIFTCLSSVLIRPRDLEDSVDIKRRSLQAANRTNYSFLHRIIHAFATQRDLFGEKQDSVFLKGQRANSFAAMDMIRNLKFVAKK